MINKFLNTGDRGEEVSVELGKFGDTVLVKNNRHSSCRVGIAIDVEIAELMIKSLADYINYRKIEEADQ